MTFVHSRKHSREKFALELASTIKVVALTAEKAIAMQPFCDVKSPNPVVRTIDQAGILQAYMGEAESFAMLEFER